jgi:DNA-binding CsgD family transcriptional regulator
VSILRLNVGGGMTSSTAGRGLLERQAELAVLERCCRQAAEGCGGVLFLEGPAGIGKTALLEATRGTAQRLELEVLAASGAELERPVAFGVVRQLLERPLRALRGSERDEILVDAARLAATVVVDPELSSPDPEAVHAALHGLYWLAAELAARQPLLLAVDDAHWADAASLRWLSYVGRRLDGVSLSLVIARRDAEPGADRELLDRVAAETGATTMRPLLLSAAAVEERMEETYGRPLAPEFVRACHAATGGNPQLLRELTSALRADDLTPGARLAARVATIAPASIARAVLLRLAPLGPDASVVAQTVAVLGSDARLDTVASLAGVSLERAAELADQLAAAGITEPGEPLRFAQPMLQAAVYDQIPAARRSLAHLAAAERLMHDTRDPGRPAAHLVRVAPAGRPWVAATLREAASAAVRRGAPDVALPLLRRALSEPARDRAEVLLELASAEATVQDPASVTHAREALEAAETPVLRARAALIAARVLVLTGAFAEALQVLLLVEPALHELDPETRQTVQAELLVQGAWQRGMTGISARLAALGVDTLGGEAPGERLLLALRAMELVVGAHPVDATLRFHRRLAALEEVEHGSDEHVTVMVATGLAVADAVDEARELLTARIDGGRTRGAIAAVASGCAARAGTELRAGRLADAEADAREALTIAVEHDLGGVVPMAVAHLVDALTDRESATAALAVLAEYGLDGDRIPLGYAGHVLLHARGRARAAAGETVRAAADLHACGRAQLQWGDRNPATLPWRSNLAGALAVLGQHGEAARLAEEEVRLAQEFGARRAIGIALRARALLHRGDEQLPGLRDAERTLADSPARLEHARSTLELGAALRRCGRRVAARATLAQALDRADRCEANALAARARSELHAAGARPRRERLSGPDALTTSEWRVAQLAAGGRTNRQIAQALFVTTKTVEMHLGHVYGKLDIHGRQELAASLAPAEALRDA